MPTTTAVVGSAVIGTGVGTNSILQQMTNTNQINISGTISTSTTTTLTIPAGAMGVFLEANITVGTYTVAGMSGQIQGWLWLALNPAATISIVTSGITGSITYTYC